MRTLSSADGPELFRDNLGDEALPVAIEPAATDPYTAPVID